MLAQYLPDTWQLHITDPLMQEAPDSTEFVYALDPKTEVVHMRVQFLDSTWTSVDLIRWLTLRVKRPGYSAVEVTFEATRHGYRSHAVTSVNGPLRSADLAGLRLTALAAEAYYLGQITRWGYDDPFLWTQEDIVLGRPPRGAGRGRSIAPEHLALAAKAWQQAREDGVPVKRAVADALTVSLPQAAVYIRRAREAGLLPPSRA